jgi:hypothetical protein
MIAGRSSKSIRKNTVAPNKFFTCKDIRLLRKNRLLRKGYNYSFSVENAHSSDSSNLMTLMKNALNTINCSDYINLIIEYNIFPKCNTFTWDIYAENDISDEFYPSPITFEWDIDIEETIADDMICISELLNNFDMQI